MYFTELKNNVIEGFYLEEINGIQKCNSVLESGGIEIDEELHQHLLSLGQCKFTGVKEGKMYTLSDKDLFEKVVQPVDDIPQQPSLEERLAALEALMMGVI